MALSQHSHILILFIHLNCPDLPIVWKLPDLHLDNLGIVLILGDLITGGGPDDWGRTVQCFAVI